LPQTSHLASTIGHCEYFVNTFNELAVKSQELAKLHEQMGKDTEQKQETACPAYILDRPDLDERLSGSGLSNGATATLHCRNRRLRRAYKRPNNSATEASHGTLAQLSAQVDLQASVLAFKNSFWVMGAVVLLLTPLPFIMRRPSAEETAAAAEAH